ncbi:biotin transporter BioY [Saxibacter everestensis]|uniref:Biotin transporter n=1 Tax=Saxibacter everestensis TaxID=2909229 RepID=A0ABY8QV11_9MICO|nr:biotin transporter BioY [Brevibacteriaceae bacterium ZFBP1038]
MKTSTSQVREARSPETGRRRQGWRAGDLALIAVFAALIATMGMLPAIPVGGVGVPITLQSLAVILTGLVLGPARGFAATALYVVVGLIGIPVFAGFTGGIGVLAKPSAGYIIAFPLVSALAGLLALIVVRKMKRAWHIPLLFVAGLLASFTFMHPLGIAGIMVNAGLDLRAAIAADAIFIPGDVIKNVVAALIAGTVHRAFPDLLARRRA